MVVIYLGKNLLLKSVLGHCVQQVLENRLKRFENTCARDLKNVPESINYIGNLFDLCVVCSTYL